MAGAEFAELDRLAARAPRLLLFAGKGGVGKTTCAAATALALAARGRLTLVFSTDPAHSLADALGQPLGHEPTPVAGAPHLRGLEVNAEQALARFRAEYGGSLTALLSAATYLSEAEAAALVELPLPGIDELMGLGRVVELLGTGLYSHLVWDSAPTGHTLRLLALPELLDLWVRFLATLQWRYQEWLPAIPQWGPDDEPVVDDGLFVLKRIIHQFRGILRDHQRSLIVAVTTAEPVALAELTRTLRDLSASGLRNGGIVVNRMVPDTGPCPHCLQRRQSQAASLKQLTRTFPIQAYYQLPELSDPPQGVDVLVRLLGSHTEQGYPDADPA